MPLFEARTEKVRLQQPRVGCVACPLSAEWPKLAHPKIRPDLRYAEKGGVSAQVYFVGEAPGATEDERGIPFVGDSGTFLRHAIRDWDISFAIGNAVRCRPPDNRTPTPVEAAACWKGFGETDLVAVKPRVVIPLGGSALGRFFPGQISEWVGEAVPHLIEPAGFATWVFPLYHPSYLLRQRSRFGEPDIIKLWRRSLDYVRDELVLRDPPAIPSRDAIVADIHCLLGHDVVIAADYLAANGGLDLLSVDLETTCLMPWERGAQILAASVSNGVKTVAFLVGHPENPYKAEAKAVLLKLCQAAKAGLIAHSAVFEQRWLSAEYGMQVFGWRWCDTMARPYAQLGIVKGREGGSDDSVPGRLAGLGKQTRLHWGFDVKTVTGVDPEKWRTIPVPDYLLYNGLDAKWTHQLWTAPLEPWARPEVTRNSASTRAAAAISWRGLLVDPAELGRQAAKLEASIAGEANAIALLPAVARYEMRARKKFQPSSPAQVAEFFGLESADEEALREVDDPLAQRILRLRKFEKMYGTYVKGIRTATYVDGYLHPDFSTMRTATGRWSSQKPNAQNMPKREDKQLRKCIVPPPGYSLVSFDYGQLEARCIAIATHDATMLSYTWADQDIHREWAIEVLDAYPLIADRLCPNTTEEKIIVKRTRDVCKNGFVFPSFYGAGVPKCAGEMQIPEDILGPVIEKFWVKYAGARKWQAASHKFYDEHFYVETMTQRRRFGPLSWTEQLNSPIQGTGSDIVVDSSIQLVDLAVETNDAHFIPMVNVHDDLSFYLPTRDLDRYIQVIARIMVTPRYTWITVPLKVEVNVGHQNWSEQHEFRSYTTADFHALPKTGLAAQVRAITDIGRAAAGSVGARGANAERRERLTLRATGLDRVTLERSATPTGGSLNAGRRARTESARAGTSQSERGAPTGGLHTGNSGSADGDSSGNDGSPAPAGGTPSGGLNAARRPRPRPLSRPLTRPLTSKKFQ